METDRLPFNQGFAVPTESSSSCALPIMEFGKIPPSQSVLILLVGLWTRQMKALCMHFFRHSYRN